MTEFKLFVDGTPFDILNAPTLGLPPYESSLSVEMGGYSSGVVKGSGFNKAGGVFTFKYIINSWDYEIIRDIQAKVASFFVWTQRRTYELRKLYNGRWYSMRLTAPKYKPQEISNLRRNEISISLLAIDNYWKDLQENSVSFVPVSGENPVLNFDSIIEVPLRFEAEVEVPLQSTDIPFFLIFGEYGGKFMNINVSIPKGYAGSNVLIFDNKSGRISDLDITYKLFGSLPMGAGNMITQYKSNLYVKNIKLFYTAGIY